MPSPPDDIVFQVEDGRRRLRCDAQPMWLSVERLRSNTPTLSDRPTQRDIIPHHVGYIAEHFTIRAFTPPLVNRRDGSYWILDGQQHVEALRGLGHTDVEIMCWVYDGLSQTEEADLFVKLNTRKAIERIARHNVQVTAEDTRATVVQMVADELGLKIQKGGGPGCIGAITTLNTIFDRYGEDTLRRSLRLLRDSFPEDPEAFDAQMVRGMSDVVHHYGSAIDDGELVQRLLSLRRGAVDIKENAKTLQHTAHAPTATCCAAEIVEAYNRRRRGSKRLASYPVKPR